MAQTDPLPSRSKTREQQKQHEQRKREKDRLIREASLVKKPAAVTAAVKVVVPHAPKIQVAPMLAKEHKQEQRLLPWPTIDLSYLEIQFRNCRVVDRLLLEIALSLDERGDFASSGFQELRGVPALPAGARCWSVFVHVQYADGSKTCWHCTIDSSAFQALGQMVQCEAQTTEQNKMKPRFLCTGAHVLEPQWENKSANLNKSQAVQASLVLFAC